MVMIATGARWHDDSRLYRNQLFDRLRYNGRGKAVFARALMTVCSE